MRRLLGRIVFGARFLGSAAIRAWAAWRAGRLAFSPRLWLVHLKNYHSEITHPESPPPAPLPTEVSTIRRPSDPRFLVITDSVPTPNFDSGSFRIVQILRLLRRMGYDVTLITHADGGQPQDVQRLRGMGVQPVLGQRAAIDHLVSEGSTYHVVLLSRPDAAFRYLFPVRANAIHATIAYDTVDLHWLRLSREAQITGENEQRRLAEHYHRIERVTAQNSDLVLTVSELERDILQDECPGVRVVVLPNIHPIPSTGPTWSERHGLMFIGGFWHRPNEDAVCYFVSEILPLIQRQIRDLNFVVVGSHVPDRIKALASESVCVLGYVEDPTNQFHQSRVFVAPLRFGAGLKGKIGQSMSYGLPVVTTPIGAEGMRLTDGESALIADDAAGFAEAVVRLYRDEALWTRIAVQSRSHIAKSFSEGTAADILNATFPVAGSTEAH